MKQTIEAKLRIGDCITLKKSDIWGEAVELVYTGMSSPDKISFAKIIRWTHGGYAYNMYLPSTKKTLGLEEGTVEIKACDEEQVWLAYTKK